jgi:hypothetical protein
VGDLSWPGLATKVDDRCGHWGPLPVGPLVDEQEVEIEERSSVGTWKGSTPSVG